MQPAPEAQPPTLAARLRELANLIAPTTVITALLVYFGAVYTDGRLAYYGIQLGLADLATHDLILYGTEGIYVPIALLFTAVLLALAVHGVVIWLVAAPGRRAATMLTAAAIGTAGLLCTARALIGIFVPGVAATEPTAVTPLSLAVGPLLVAYSGWILAKVAAGRLDRSPLRGTPTGLITPARRTAIVAVVMLTLTGLFWATNRFAFTLGLSRSYGEAVDGAGAYRLVLDTKDQLTDPPPGVTVTPLTGGPDNPFRYRYQGFRLVLESGGRLFLVPHQWTRDARTLVLPYDESVRIELIPPPKNLAPR